MKASSAFPPFRVEDAKNLVDGIQTNVFPTGKTEPNPWFRIDLGLDSCYITQIQISGRFTEKMGFINVCKQNSWMRNISKIFKILGDVFWFLWRKTFLQLLFCLPNGSFNCWINSLQKWNLPTDWTHSMEEIHHCPKSEFGCRISHVWIRPLGYLLKIH